MNRWIAIGAAICVGLFAFAYFNKTDNVSRSHSHGLTRLGHTAGDDVPSIRFTISNDRPRQSITDDPPFTTPGGLWTVFECLPADDPKAVIVVAVPTFVQRSNGAPAASSRAIMWTYDRATADRVVSVFAKAFHQPVPPAAPSAAIPTIIRPMKLTTAVLGEHVRRDGDSFVSEGNGTWTATKLFLQNGGVEAEVFFNYDVVNHVGEFAEKDPQSDANLVALIAQGLRDGSYPSQSAVPLAR